MVQFSSVTQSCPTLCNPVNRSTPGLPVHHQLPDGLVTEILKFQTLVTKGNTGFCCFHNIEAR